MQFELSFQGFRAIADSHGGELVSLRDTKGTEYIWSGDPAFWAGRNPLLFPIVGSLKGGKVQFDGKEYKMSRHGFARDQEFEVADRTEDRIVFELRENQSTLARYPYPFKVQVCHQLTQGGFSTSLRVENTGDKPMPFCIGAHTAFRCPLREGERFEDYEIIFDRPEEASMRLLTKEGLLSSALRERLLAGQERFTLDYELFARIDTVILENLKSESIRLAHRENGHGVRMEFKGFPMLAFWTKGVEKAPFVCLEPWHGCAAVEDETGEFTDKPHCITLGPGEVKSLEYKVFCI